MAVGSSVRVALHASKLYRDRQHSYTEGEEAPTPTAEESSFRALRQPICNPTISNNSIFASNHSLGGGMYSSRLFSEHCEHCYQWQFEPIMGAAIYFESSPGSLTNCTIVRNTATREWWRRCLYCAKSSPTIVNSILWQDMQHAHEICYRRYEQPQRDIFRCVLGAMTAPGISMQILFSRT